jgi:hypothetical protein
MAQPITRPIPIRFDACTRTRLRSAAKRLGSNPSAVVRFAVLQQLPMIESGMINLSVDKKAS